MALKNAGNGERGEKQERGDQGQSEVSVGEDSRRGRGYRSRPSSATRPGRTARRSLCSRRPRSRWSSSSRLKSSTPRPCLRSTWARVESIQSVSVKPQISGEIAKVCFKEGSVVKAGQLLFQIDPKQYEATVQLRKAELQQAEANLVTAEKYYKRVTAASERAVSATDRDTAEGELPPGQGRGSAGEGGSQTRADRPRLLPHHIADNGKDRQGALHEGQLRHAADN